MQEIIKYKPYDDWKTFDIIKDNGKTYFKLYDELFEINPNEYIPKAGLLYDEVLQGKCAGKSVLDLGCGYLSILGLIARHYGASNVTAVDIDDNCLEWLQYVIKQNGINNISPVHSNFFSSIESDAKYDLILANPPHMPMLSGRLCDTGGLDGKKYIYEILNGAYSHLNLDSELYIMMFDFLGVDKQYNDDYTIEEYAKKIGYKKIETVYSKNKKIIEGSVTYSCLDYIKQVYPKYDFGENPAECNIIIVKFSK